MRLQSLWEIVFFLRPKVGRWLLGIDGTVGPPQQQLGFLFYKTQVAFMYVYGYKVEKTLSKHTSFVLPTSIQNVSMKQTFVIFLSVDNKNKNKLTNGQIFC